MNEITLGGRTYILEAIEDTEAPAHDYDAVTDINADASIEELDQWFAKIEAEWDDLPKEVRVKIIDKMAELNDKLESNFKDIVGEERVEEPVED